MILLDTYVLIWARVDPDRLPVPALDAVRAADRLAIADITLWEIAMLVRKGRVALEEPLDRYLTDVAAAVTVLPITAAVAAVVGALAEDFPTRDPADRLVYATAQVHGLPLVSADRPLRTYDPSIIWD